MDTPVLSCQNLCKRYKKGAFVLDNFNMTLPKGKIIGLLGPNGCGKSTLIKLICGLLVPDFGTIEICGEPVSEKTNRLVSYLPERTYLNMENSAAEIIEFFADFYDDFDPKRAQNMLADLKIDPYAKLKTLSKGMKEKVQLVMVMSRRAKLYLLDEPIAGVDPAARDYILSTIIRNYDEDATILITTHLIHDVENVLDEFCFMGYDGRVFMSGSVDEVRAEKQKSLDELFREVYKC